ncbi:hypothetical protein NPIL_151091 [Nephila pilipes]|uniref:Uncharacterized protein n=1 Tax=Nephila pilipes TaxID=299642 RepID=A0A8X6NHK7_NEPPI|nr:hypothetical protein NPIL_151091 [Nephila pilipes]
MPTRYYPAPEKALPQLMTCFHPFVDAITGKRKYKWFVVLLVNVSIHRFSWNRFAVSQLSREKRWRFLRACSCTFDCCSACLEFLIGMAFHDFGRCT